jgi:hypothetical protein
LIYVNRDADQAIARLARRQHGLWTRQQALTAGASGSLIDRRLRSGAWLQLDRAVYGSPAAAPTWHRSVMAAVLAEPDAVASHKTAAVLHGLHGFRGGRPVVTVPPGANVRGRLAIVHRGVDVRTTVIDQIPCVTIEQVFIDLAPKTSVRRLREALARATDATPDVLDAVRDRFCELAPRGGRQLGRLRAVLEEFGAGEEVKESVLERSMRGLFTRPGIPPIRWQAPFPGRDPGARRVDGVIPDWSVVLEGDGRSWHTRIDDFERDRRRDQASAAAGYLTLRYTYHQIVREPAWCVDTLLEAGTRRAAA